LRTSSQPPLARDQDAITVYDNWVDEAEAVDGLGKLVNAFEFLALPRVPIDSDFCDAVAAEVTACH
jgi:hypothetical protein